MTTPDEFRESFERRGKANVIAFIEAGKSRPGVLDDGTLEAIRWLSEVEAKEAAEASSKRDAREEEILAIAREANDIARSASFAATAAASAATDANDIALSTRRVAIAAAVIAIVTAIAQIIWR